MVSEARLVDRQAGDPSSLTSLFMSMTAKQHEVLALIAESRTSKEIAHQLGVSESAVNQRLEAVRCRAGFPPRATLARAYRRHLDAVSASQAFLDHIHKLSEEGLEGNGSADQRLADPGREGLSERPQSISVTRLDLLNGEDARLYRTAAMVCIALGLLVTAMVGLGVANAIMAAT